MAATRSRPAPAPARGQRPRRLGSRRVVAAGRQDADTPAHPATPPRRPRVRSSPHSQPQRRAPPRPGREYVGHPNDDVPSMSCRRGCGRPDHRGAHAGLVLALGSMSTLRSVVSTTTSPSPPRRPRQATSPGRWARRGDRRQDPEVPADQLSLQVTLGLQRELAFVHLTGRDLRGRFAPFRRRSASLEGPCLRHQEVAASPR
jgi:hypothetical protein